MGPKFGPACLIAKTVNRLRHVVEEHKTRTLNGDKHVVDSRISVGKGHAI